MFDAEQIFVAEPIKVRIRKLTSDAESKQPHKEKHWRAKWLYRIEFDHD
jgi:hypothetical protein